MNIDPVKAVDDKVERVKKDLNTLTARLDDVETTAAQHQLSATNQVRDANRKLTKTNDRVTELAESVHRLERLLVALNRKVRAGGTQKADFDHWPEIGEPLIAKIVAGQEAYARKAFTPQEAQDARKAIAKYDTRLAQAVDAAEGLTNLPANAESLWRRKYASWQAFTRLGQRPQAPDDEAHAEDASAKAQGNEAVAEARRQIRERIEDAVARDLLFPAWFENVLGPAAPPGRAGDWLYTATDVVLYRVLHGVDSPADALGPAPREQGHRRTLHERLVVECAEYRKA